MNKLKDNTGASITFALLLFMVCAVVSSVLITAGTVAVGRISESSSTDSRYYSVMSAVNVLDDLYSDSNVTLRKTVVTHNIIPVTGTGEKTGYSDSPVIKVLLDGNDDLLMTVDYKIYSEEQRNVFTDTNGKYVNRLYLLK